METIGAFDAKTQFSALLERVARGEEIVVTKHGKPVARLVPFADVTIPADHNAIISALKAGRAAHTLGLDWKALRDSGRK